MAIIDAAYLARIMPAEEFAKVFDRDGTGTPDTTAIDNAILLAESTGQMWLNGGKAVTIPMTGTIDEGVKIAFARMAIYEAVRFSTSDGMGGIKSPYRQAYEDAVAFLKSYKMDEVRPLTANGGERSYPRAAMPGFTNKDGNVGGEYGRMAAGSDTTGF